MTTQKYREVAIETPLGADVLLLKEATITEALSQPFVVDLQLLSDQEDILVILTAISAPFHKPEMTVISLFITPLCVSGYGS